jgi:hypothetical protein
MLGGELIPVQQPPHRCQAQLQHHSLLLMVSSQPFLAYRLWRLLLGSKRKSLGVADYGEGGTCSSSAAGGHPPPTHTLPLTKPIAGLDRMSSRAISPVQRVPQRQRRDQGALVLATGMLESKPCRKTFCCAFSTVTQLDTIWQIPHVQLRASIATARDASIGRRHWLYKARSR